MTRSRLPNLVLVQCVWLILFRLTGKLLPMGVKAGDKVAIIFHIYFAQPLCLCPRPFQVLLPEYGGMQVKIDDKELFMFRCVSHFIFVKCRSRHKAQARVVASLTLSAAGTTRSSVFSSRSEARAP